MISVDVQSKNYGGEDVLRNIQFSLEAGETLAIVGPSGIGKSTLLRIVAGLDSEFQGSVTQNRKIGMVFQEPTLLPWRSVLKNLTIFHKDIDEDQALDMLNRVGLASKSGLFPRQLSLGQQRRLSLARAFLGQPEMLILDEPFASLDPDLRDGMLALTEELIGQERPASLLVTHDMVEARRLATRISALQGNPATLQEVAA